MEATNQQVIYQPVMYSPKWKLTIEFLRRRDQGACDPKTLLSLLYKILEENPWMDNQGNPLKESFEISIPVLRPMVRPYGPETEIVFDCSGPLLLSRKQFYAYDKWTQRISSRLEEEIAYVLQSVGSSTTVTWFVTLYYDTLLQQDTESYRLSSKPGDVVRMACGTLAVVIDFNILIGGHIKELTLRPICGIFHHLRLLFSWSRKLHPTEGQIDKLTKIGEISITQK